MTAVIPRKILPTRGALSWRRSGAVALGFGPLNVWPCCFDRSLANRAATRLPEVARFSYSLDGKPWTPIGRPSKLSYTVPHFMGYRFALFFYSTKTTGGSVDFDYYRIGQESK